MSLIISQVLLASFPNVTTYLAALCASLLNASPCPPSLSQWHLCLSDEARDSCFVAVPSLATCRPLRHSIPPQWERIADEMELPTRHGTSLFHGISSYHSAKSR
ncbi:hypothetical protein, unlikely [Trypanosoma congolense IL3000]|uniref:T. congolense-specific, cell surface-expressed gene family n=1 Tax=Trypanosoma congolense (strain IL3000) TaxID=1068625 RepID=F9WHQ2_TRYCI|nr:hypothetical protein, unlikely [Trypanosoma congolense IL3000]